MSDRLEEIRQWWLDRGRHLEDADETEWLIAEVERLRGACNKCPGLGLMVSRGYGVAGDLHDSYTTTFSIRQDSGDDEPKDE